MWNMEGSMQVISQDYFTPTLEACGDIPDQGVKTTFYSDYHYYTQGDVITEINNGTLTPTITKTNSSIYHRYALSSPVEGKVSKDYFLAHHQTYLQVDEGGIYDLQLKITDGHRMFIDDQEVQEFNQWISKSPSSKTARVALKKGIHKLDLYNFEYTDISTCILSWKKYNDDEYIVIPPEKFFIENPVKSFVYDEHHELITQNILADDYTSSLFVKGSSIDYFLITSYQGKVYYHYFQYGNPILVN